MTKGNNSTKINKPNNYLSPQITEHNKSMAYDDGNQDSVFGHVQRMGESNVF
jgi:hypothetical protein